ncbi:RsmD family RNA methyltransferase [Candidatus Saccharibacteria bacterium]|nr:RsmD family RNA methyltransferase [Candidatus Saccharibacteria bacterium]
MNNIRITSGIYRGRSIKSPASALTHPMGSREKLGLFNMIAEYLPGATVLDAFAGSGALGIEALSRGAQRVIFVENASAAIHAITANCKALGIAPTQAVLYRGKVSTFCNEFVLEEGEIRVILADPPYDDFDLAELNKLPKCLASGGILVLSHPGSAPPLPELELQKTRKYAGATISIYSKPE